MVRSVVFFIFLPVGFEVCADGSTIDKVYHPYVQLLEKEIEYRALYEQDSDKVSDGKNRHKLGYGQALSDRFFAEAYLIGVDEPGSNFELEAYEVELKWQLTEQGEYDNDWGLLFELEKERNENIWEISTTLIALHEWSGWVATGNLSVIYEWGNDVDNEWETAFSGQLRYRHNERLEPGIEIYQSQDTQGIGPVITGLQRFGGGKKLNWEFGAIFGTDDDTADVNWKFNLEYEFQ
ncbi:MAG: hypothetical protein JKY93_00290 [Gammaproteobacteria bacterium]|nr:hypothetical protein [Gammaproteobacteria bacterium]